MSGLLTWRRGLASDRAQLSVFECTSRTRTRRTFGPHGWAKSHPRVWELEVQSKLRSLRPPLVRPLHMLTGHDKQGLAAVVVYEELDGLAQIDLHLAAIATRHRRKGGGVADELVATTLDTITSRAFEVGLDLIELATLVHEKNEPSQALCRRFGLRHTGQETDDLQQWTGTLVLEKPDPDHPLQS